MASIAQSFSTARAVLSASLAAALLLAAGAAMAQDRTVTDFRGEVTIPEAPERIVVLNLPALGDPLLTLGFSFVGAPGVGNPQGLSYLPEGTLDGVADLGTAREINLEALAATDPDLIISTDQNANIQAQLDAIAPSFVVDTTGIATDRWTILEQLVGALDADDALADWRAEYEARTAELRPLFEGHTLSFVRLVPDALMTYHPGSPIGGVLEDIGFDVVDAPTDIGTATLENYIVSLSLEQAAAITGDIVFAFTGNLTRADAEALIASPVWQTLPAVAAGNVALVVESETGFLLLPWARHGTLHDLELIETVLGPLVADH